MTIITFNVGGDDSWLRARIRGIGERAPEQAQSVIVEDSREADRLFAAMSQLKLSRGKPFGGAISEQIDVEPADIRAERLAQYGHLVTRYLASESR